jgi:signal transduction histidine kinase
VERWWRVVAAYRVLALVFVVALAAAGVPPYEHPLVGAAGLVALTVWTVTISVASLRRGTPSVSVLVADVVVAVAAIGLTTAVVSSQEIGRGAATLAGPWAAAAVLSAAVALGWPAGVVAALVVFAADVVERGGLSQNTIYGGVLLLLAGGLVGYLVALSRRAEAATAVAARLEAAAQERERLAADIHDSVLQVLALVARRGTALGGEAGELGRLAAEQESALRTLVSTPLPVVDDRGEIDVRALLEPLAGDRVTVAGPATPVPLPGAHARTVAAATRAALDNVQRHAGPTAHAWVLVEDAGDAVCVSIRDDGVGMTPDRLAAARAEGRLGVEHSIVGRLRAIGGAAVVDSAPGAGTEVELRVPRGR